MGGFPKYLQKDADNKGKLPQSAAKPRSNAVQEKPSYTPDCCGKPSKWIEISVNMAYFYCDKCKQEVGLKAMSSDNVAFSKGDGTMRIPLPQGVPYAFGHAGSGGPQGSGQTSPGRPTWVPQPGQRLDEYADLSIGDVVVYRGKQGFVPHRNMTFGRTYDVVKPTGSAGDAWFVTIIDDSGCQDGYPRDCFEFAGSALQNRGTVSGRSQLSNVYTIQTGETVMNWLDRVFHEQMIMRGTHAKTVRLSIQDHFQLENEMIMSGVITSRASAVTQLYVYGPSHKVIVEVAPGLITGYLETF